MRGGRARRMAIVMVSSCLFTATPLPAQAQFWDADPATVQKVDAQVAALTAQGVGNCPPAQIAEFGRYYSGFTEAGGRRVIVGQLRRLKEWGRALRPGGPPEAEAGIHIVRGAIAIADGGCTIENVWFDAETLKLIQIVPGGR